MITMPVDQFYWTVLIAHELVHMYQFEIGKTSFSYAKNGAQPIRNGYVGFIYDLTDEVEAYNMASVFGGPKVSLDELKASQYYSQYSSEFHSVQTYIDNRPSCITLENIEQYLQSLSDDRNVVFRYNNKLFRPEDLIDTPQETVEQQNENTKMVNKP